MGNTAVLFRLIAASLLVGLAAFCIANVAHVWRKRNAKPGSPGRSVARRFAWAALLTGLVVTPTAVVARSLSRTEGYLTGEGLFVVRARSDQLVMSVAESGAVAAGAVLVRFGSDPRIDRAEEHRARIARAEAEYDRVAFVPRTAAPELVREQQDLLHERVLVQQEYGQVVLAAEAAARDLTLQAFTKTETLARLDRTLTERRKDLKRAAVRQELARDLFTIYHRLAAREMVATAEYRRIETDARDSDVEVAALAQEIRDLSAEQSVLKSQVAAIEAEKANREGAIAARQSEITARLARLEADETEIRGKIAADLTRSGRLRDIERQQAAAMIREQKAAAEGFARESVVRAPFAGRVAFRAASPNANYPGGALAVLAPENGFLLTARMEQSDAGVLREGGDATIEVLDGDSPERVIPATFRHAEPLQHEPGQAVLRLECRPPPLIARRLADGEPVKVEFVWYPPLGRLASVRSGCALLIAGAVGLAVTARVNVLGLAENPPAPVPAPVPVPAAGTFTPAEELVPLVAVGRAAVPDDFDDIVPLEPVPGFGSAPGDNWPGMPDAMFDMHVDDQPVGSWAGIVEQAKLAGAAQPTLLLP
ncbi:MAG: HlyD family efflux transporter periplasmic adaptor subunit, partial [Fimbriiglobus sp.]